MTKRRQYVISFHSQKGGVGKTSLAWHLASHLAQPGLLPQREEEPPLKVALIDADLTGTSLADAVPLRARKALAKPGTRFQSVEDTRATLKNDYCGSFPQKGRATPPLAFLNRLLLCDPVEYRGLLGQDGHLSSHAQAVQFSHYLWLSERSDQISVIPSSSHPEDVEAIAPHLFREDFTDHFCHRIADLVLALLGRNIGDGSLQAAGGPLPDAVKDGHDVVIIDSAPTLHGISRAVLRCHAEVARRLKDGKRADSDDVSRTTAFVMSEDVQDIAALGRSLHAKLNEDSDGRDRANKMESPPKSLLILNRYSEKNIDGSDRRIPRPNVDEIWDMTSADDARAYYHNQLVEYLADPHDRLRKRPGETGALFTDAIPVPDDEWLATTFKGDRLSDVPDWGHHEAFARLIDEVLE